LVVSVDGAGCVVVAGGVAGITGLGAGSLIGGGVVEAVVSGSVLDPPPHCDQAKPATAMMATIATQVPQPPPELRLRSGGVRRSDSLSFGS
jgi:hypothetical protein